jgi:hypothetical protein
MLTLRVCGRSACEYRIQRHAQAGNIGFEMTEG